MLIGEKFILCQFNRQCYFTGSGSYGLGPGSQGLYMGLSADSYQTQNSSGSESGQSQVSASSVIKYYGKALLSLIMPLNI